MKFQYLKILLPGLISLLAASPAPGQEKFNVALGWGSPELLNVGIRYQMEQSQLGLYAGFSAGSFEDAFTLGADVYYHFGALSVLSARRPWYARFGLNYHTIENEYESYNFLLLVPRIGKDFNLSPKVGIAGDFGVSLPLSSKEEEFYYGKSLRNDILPSLGISIFYRL